MKALSVRQPFAWLIISGHKLIENRKWTTRYRGPLLIHAGLRPDQNAWNDIEGITIPAELDAGCIIGRVNLVTVLTAKQARDRMPNSLRWINGPYCFVLRNPQRFAKPIETPGRLNLFDVHYAPIVAPPR